MRQHFGKNRSFCDNKKYKTKPRELQIFFSLNREKKRKINRTILKVHENTMQIHAVKSINNGEFAGPKRELKGAVLHLHKRKLSITF